MDTEKKINPVYSTSNSEKVELSNDEWAKILPKDVYDIARKKEPSDLSRGNIMLTLRKELITCKI